jgi:hypothetical protein
MSPAPKGPAQERDAHFVDQIVTDPKNVPDVMRLYGYSGASSEELCDRLYLDPGLQNYVEVPTSAILNRMAVPKDQDPYGATVLWVRRDAALKYKMAPAAQALVNYFRGAFDGAIAGAAAAGGGVGVQPWLRNPMPGSYWDCSFLGACYGDLPAAAAPGAAAFGAFPSPGFWKCTWYCGLGSTICRPTVDGFQCGGDEFQQMAQPALAAQAAAPRAAAGMVPWAGAPHPYLRNPMPCSYGNCGWLLASRYG